MIGAACCLLAGGTVLAAETETEFSLDGLFGKELPTEAPTSRKKITFVVDGFEFICPNEYSLIYFDEVGPTVYIPDAFQMRTVIRDASYEEILKDKEAMTSKALAAGATITTDVTETEVDGTMVAYFRMNLGEDDTMAMYFQSPNPEKILCGQMVVQNPNLKEEEILKIFVDVMSSAVETDKPNSTRKDVEDQVYAPEPIGDVKEESTLQHGKEEVTFKVPEGFYSVYGDLCDMYATENFSTVDYTDVDIFVYGEILGFEDAKAYIEDHALLYADRAECNVETLDVDDHTFYGFAVEYDAEEDKMARVYAACDLPNGGMYLISAVSINGEEELTIDTVKDFMEIQ